MADMSALRGLIEAMNLGLTDDAIEIGNWLEEIRHRPVTREELAADDRKMAALIAMVANERFGGKRSGR